MYRQLGAIDKAIADFQKAGRINPRHLQSWFNLGIVYAQDKKDNAAAAKAWNKVIEIDPCQPPGRPGPPIHRCSQIAASGFRPTAPTAAVGSLTRTASDEPKP